MKVIDLTKTNLNEAVQIAVEVLQKGGIVIYPTETVYGVGVDATNQAAVDRVLAYKSRREGKPLSIAVTDADMAAKYVKLTDQSKTLYQQFLPGPVTVVSPTLGKVAEGVASEFGTLGIRIPAYPLVIEIVKKLGKPITATSANASGKKRPYTVSDILERLSAKQQSMIDLVLDAGTLPPNPPSTVIDTTLSTPLVMRQGAKQLAGAGQPGSTTTFESYSDQETMDIAGKLMLKHYQGLKTTGLVIGLEGALGAGKTVFTKGVGSFLHISETINSPTYNYCNEYEYKRYQETGMLYHCDAWKVDSLAEYKLLALPELVKPHTVMVIEWWSQIGQFLLADLDPTIPVIQAALADKGETHRTITVTEPPKTR